MSYRILSVLCLSILASSTCLTPAQAAPAKGDRKAEMMKRYDKDGDGQLSESEKKAAMGSRGGKATAGKRGAGGSGGKAEMMKRFDKDGDGKLSESEKKAAIASRGGKGNAGKGGAGDRRAEMMKRFDKDGDGQLSESEKKAAMERGGKAKSARKPKK